MQTKNAWTTYSESDICAVHAFANDYKNFISHNKTEREIVSFLVKEAKDAGYVDLNEKINSNTQLKPGDKVYSVNRNKTIMLVHIGKQDLTQGLNILGAHIDSPRLDIKQNPIDEMSEICYLDTHYYGGIKKYQWLTMPLAIHGVICKKDGTTVTITVGEDSEDPVFCISDILPHLGKDQLQKKVAEAFEGENLDLIVGSIPSNKSEDSSDKKVAQYILDTLKELYNVEEEDFLSAELEVVPAGKARDLGFDRSMILGYGHDDRSCAYTSFRAMLETDTTERTNVCLLVDKEEIGSYGATGMTSVFFEHALNELLVLTGAMSPVALNRCLSSSYMLSSDVSACFDPIYPGQFEKKNSCFMGHGLTFNKYTGAGGKGGCSDADGEFVAKVRNIMDTNNIVWQTAELGKVDAGGGGTIASLIAMRNIHVIDCGVGAISMHAPWELISKADLYEAYKGYKAFLKDA